MKRMWIRLKEGQDLTSVKRMLGELGRIEEDPDDPRRVVLTFRNQSDSGILMAGFQMSENYMQYFDDFDMIREE